MKTLSITLRTVTPLFLGGCDSQAELRGPSIKGALRFWFRFAEGARQGGNLTEVRQAEDRLFGSAGEGTGLFRVRLRSRPVIFPAKSEEWSIAMGYLGYGPVGKRSFIAPKQQIEFDFVFTKKATNSDIQRVYESLWLWTHLGGFGSRARRGWGSLALQEPATGFVPRVIVDGDKEQIETQIRDGIANIVGTGSLPVTASYTHWFSKARVLCPTVELDGIAAMESIAAKLIQFRSNSRRFHGAGPSSPCWGDHELLSKYLVEPEITSGVPNLDYQLPSAAPRRSVFGLPQNYTFSRTTLPNNPSMASVTAVWVDKKGHETEIDRRSSPLLLHFHKVNETQGKYQVAVIVTFVPAQMLPAATTEGKSMIKFSPQYDPHDPPDPPHCRPRSHTPPDHLVDPPNDWTTVETFLGTL